MSQVMHFHMWQVCSLEQFLESLVDLFRAYRQTNWTSEHQSCINPIASKLQSCNCRQPLDSIGLERDDHAEDGHAGESEFL